jgi:phenylpyruvate tautomerase PptA (4-oxalocrotonate tautomerase family)
MPLIQVSTTETIAEASQKPLLQKLSRAIAEGIGKPESYVMVVLHPQSPMLHGGAPGPAAFVDVRSIGGLGSRVCKALSERICALLLADLKVPGERVYLNFTDVPAGSWGHDAGTFG